jgi:hypothetical protein
MFKFTEVPGVWYTKSMDAPHPFSHISPYASLCVLCNFLYNKPENVGVFIEFCELLEEIN